MKTLKISFFGPPQAENFWGLEGLIRIPPPLIRYKILLRGGILKWNTPDGNLTENACTKNENGIPFKSVVRERIVQEVHQVGGFSWMI